ncbi:MAG: DUF4349 domain-containing protein [Gemmatimonadaceae bacterium]|nr:DUF4349 domain-containing protein [Gemmatimonadaceae bacterium]
MTIRNTILCITVFAVLACDRETSKSEAAADGTGVMGAPASASTPEMREQAMHRSAKPGMTDMSDESQSAPAAVQTTPQPSAQPATPAMMIRTGYAMLEVSKLDPAVDKVRALAAKVGGYVTNTSTTGGRDQVRTAMLELRIPAQRYDEAIAALTEIGRVESTQTSAQDVGEEFVDLTARIGNLRKLEARLIDLLANRTGRLQDVLSVERELSRVRTEIDQIEGRLRYLKDRVSTSTLTVNLHEPQPLIGNAPGENPIGAAVRKAWQNFVGLFAWLIASLGVVIPIVGIAAIVWFVVRKRIRRKGV